MERDVDHLIERLHESGVGTEDPNIAGPDEPVILEADPTDDKPIEV